MLKYENKIVEIYIRFLLGIKKPAAAGFFIHCSQLNLVVYNF